MIRQFDHVIVDASSGRRVTLRFILDVGNVGLIVRDEAGAARAAVKVESKGDRVVAQVVDAETFARSDHTAEDIMLLDSSSQGTKGTATGGGR